MAAEAAPLRLLRRSGNLWRAAAAALLVVLVAHSPVARAQQSAPLVARPCAEGQVCAGNATCLLDAETDKPFCVGKTRWRCGEGVLALERH